MKGDEMLSKWEWLASRCEALNLNDAAAIARQIEEILLKIYEDTLTEPWIKDYSDLPKNPNVDDLKWIANCAEYCVACITEIRRCPQCQYAIVAGQCNDAHSLYQEFRRLLKVK